MDQSRVKLDRYLANLEIRCATIDELLSERYETSPSQKDDLERSSRRLAAWCRMSASGDWGLFAKRLSRDKLTFEFVLGRLATVRINPRTKPPRWVADAKWVIDSLSGAVSAQDAEGQALRKSPKPFDQVPFEDLFHPLIASAERELMRELPVGFPVDSFCHAIRDMRNYLLRRLALFCSPVLYDLLVVWRSQLDQKELNIEAERDNFAEFIRFVRDQGIGDLIVKSPILFRSAGSIARQWVEATAEFLIRFRNDLPQIRSSFLRDDDAEVIGVDAGLSDLHNFGRTVLRVQFAGGRAVFYKPKDLQIDRWWAELVAWLNTIDPPVAIRTVKVLSREGYGWVEEIKHSECARPSEPRDFYRKAGSLLALLHVLAATDMHAENVIASGVDPVAIDLEMLLHSPGIHGTKGGTEARALHEAAQRIADSVIESRLLPSYSRGRKGELYSIGGLSSTRREGDELQWDGVNTIMMRPVRRPRVLNKVSNLPYYDGAPITLTDYSADFIEGFREYALFISRNRVVLAEHPFFEAVRSVPVRRLLRPTRFYALLLKRLGNHKHMNDGAEWSAQLDFVSRFSNWDELDEPLWSLGRTEREALRDFNVPFFSVLADSIEIRAKSGLSATTGGVSGLSRARGRLLSFGATDVAWQTDVIRAVLSPLAHTAERSTDNDAARLIQSAPAALHISDAVSSAIEEISRHLKRLAIEQDGGAAWVGLDWLGDADVPQLVPLGHDLYSGAPGIALFLAACHRVTGDRDMRALAIAAVSALRNEVRSSNSARFARRMGLGAATGVGSVVYSLATLGDLLHSDEIVRDAGVAAELVTPDLIKSDRQFDVVGGAAGAILGLLKLYRLNGSAEARQRAIDCGEHLLAQRNNAQVFNRVWISEGNGKRPLAGYSHGAAGSAFALASLYSATLDLKFLECATELIKFENELFDEGQRNWPDLRDRPSSLDPAWVCQWCHGASGIGLARLGISRLGVGLERLADEDIVRAVDLTRRVWRNDNDSLCCGSMGNIELLFEAAKHFDDDELERFATNATKSVINSARARGDFKLKMVGSRFNLGLFRGVSGIGYSMARRIDAELPNALLWA